MNNSWFEVMQYTFQTLWVKVISLVPEIVTALIILIVGWMIAGMLKSVVTKLINKLRVDDALRSTGLSALAERSGYTLKTGALVGTLVWWFVMLVIVIVALDILNLNQVNVFLREVVLGYLPQVIVAVLILFGGLILAGVVEKGVVAGATSVRFGSPNFLGAIAKYAIVLFSVLAALNQLSIATELVQMFFAGMVFAVSLALGLAFGLGGRDAAREYLANIGHSKSGVNNNDHSGHSH